MKFKVCVEQRRLGVIEVEIPDGKWETTDGRYARRRLVKKYAGAALANGAEVEWGEPEAIEATTSFCVAD